MRENEPQVLVFYLRDTLLICTAAPQHRLHGDSVSVVPPHPFTVVGG